MIAGIIGKGIQKGIGKGLEKLAGSAEKEGVEQIAGKVAKAGEEAVAPAESAVAKEAAAAKIETQAPKTFGGVDDGAYSAKTNSEGLTVRAEGRITGPHPKRLKGNRPEPIGGREEGHHRGHLVPENLVENPGLVNGESNIISEAAKSNLGPKRIFENLAGRIAKTNPNAVVKTIHEPHFIPSYSP
jgi:hypothetical protein